MRRTKTIKVYRKREWEEFKLLVQTLVVVPLNSLYLRKRRTNQSRYQVKSTILMYPSLRPETVNYEDRS